MGRWYFHQIYPIPFLKSNVSANFWCAHLCMRVVIHKVRTWWNLSQKYEFWSESSKSSIDRYNFVMSWNLKKLSILGESRVSNADSCVFQVSLKITSSLPYLCSKIRRPNNAYFFMFSRFFGGKTVLSSNLSDNFFEEQCFGSRMVCSFLHENGYS